MPNSVDPPQSSAFALSQGGAVTRALRRLFLRAAHVSTVDHVSPNFRLIELAGDELKNAKWIAGQHIQIGVGRGMTNRTYTPMSWDAENGRIPFLVFLHGNGAGCQWVRNAQVNGACELIGPRRSLDASGNEGPLVLFGDETCFGLAVALGTARPSANIRYVFEVSDPTESRFVLERFGLGQAAVIQRAKDNAHLVRVNAEFAPWCLGDAQFVLGGNARSIQNIRKNLTTSGVGSSRIKVKPYWAPGKAGLN